MKLCDFGWAVQKGKSLRKTFCGTPLYVSPEILLGVPYCEKSDNWSVGIFVYELLFGTIPFAIQTEAELKKIVEDDIVFPPNKPASEDSKDFIMSVLKKNPSERLTLEQMVAHPFLNKSNSLDTSLLF